MQLGLFSVSYAGYWGQQKLPVADFVVKAASLGFDTVMLAGKRPHVSPLDMNEDQIASLQGALVANGVKCGVVAGYTDLSLTAAVEVPYLEMQIAYVEALSHIAAALDCSIVRVFTAYEVDGHGPYQIWKTVATALQEICDRAAVHGVTIALQNHRMTLVSIQMRCSSCWETWTAPTAAWRSTPGLPLCVARICTMRHCALLRTW